MAAVLGSRIEPMRDLRPEEDDPLPEASDGRLMEYGLCHVDVEPDPLFDGLPARLDVAQFHNLMLSTLGADLVNLGQSDECPVQALRHRRRPLYGVQFHPEYATDEYPHGRKVLENFFRIARASSSDNRRMSE